MESMMRENKLYDASFRGDIRALEELLRQDKLALNHCGSSSGFCFNESPLHIAASRGHVDFAKVLLQHKPDLVNELDSRLRAPLHLASANGRVEMVKLLLNADSDVCLIEDEFGRTPFHLAAMVKGQVEVINELVRARPELVMYPLNRMKTVAILHLYVLRNGPKALDQLVEVDHTFLNSQDGEGNTILHKVVALKQLEILKYLANRAQLVMNLKNGNGFTALDIVKQMPRDPQTTKMCKLLLNAKLSSQDNKMKDNEKSLLEKKRDAMLIAATVIAGMAYQAGLDPPGGVWDQNYQTTLNIQGKNLTFLTGRSIMAVNYPREYCLFWAFNTMSFVASLSIVLLLIHGSPSMGTTWFRVLKQKVFMQFLTVVIWVVATTMSLTYFVAMLTITPCNAIKFNIDNLGFKVEGRGTGDIIIFSVLAWLGLVCIVFIMNAAHFFGCIIVKVVTCINRSGRNANEALNGNLINHHKIRHCSFSLPSHYQEIEPLIGNAFERQRPEIAMVTNIGISMSDYGPPMLMGCLINLKRGVVADSEDFIKSSADALGMHGFINYFSLQVLPSIFNSLLLLKTEELPVASLTELFCIIISSVLGRIVTRGTTVSGLRRFGQKSPKEIVRARVSASESILAEKVKSQEEQL
ncbi:hypothetical protein LguiB_016463 [Lonicera macranthoides]